MKMTASLYGVVGAAIINLPHESIPMLYSVFVIVLILSIHLCELTILDTKPFPSPRQKAILKLGGFIACFVMLNTIYHYPFPTTFSQVLEIVVLGGFFGVLVYIATLKDAKKHRRPPPF